MIARTTNQYGEMDGRKQWLNRLASIANQREQEIFSRWLQMGGQSEPDTDTNEGAAAWSQLHDLYEFCEWIKAHNATITEVLPLGLVAADGPHESRRYEPEGGLTIEQWPYLKDCCAYCADEDITQICRDEIVEAILENQLQKKGHTFNVADSAVDKLARQCGELKRGPLWATIEELPFEELIGSLDKDATAISKELREYRRKQKSESHPHPDGPDERSRTLLLHGKPSPSLCKRQFRLVSALWHATEHSLPLEDVASLLWGTRAAAVNGNHAHRTHVLGGRIAEKIDNITFSVKKDPDQIGIHYRVTLNLL